MWDHEPPLHAQISICIYVIMLPYLDDIVVLFMGLYAGRMGSLYVPHGMENLYVPYATCFTESIGLAMFVSVEFLTPCGIDYVHLIMNLEEKFMEYWIVDHLAYGRILTHDDGVTNGGGEVLQHSPYQLIEDKQHFGEEDYNIPN